MGAAQGLSSCSHLRQRGDFVPVQPAALEVEPARLVAGTTRTPRSKRQRRHVKPHLDADAHAYNPDLDPAVTHAVRTRARSPASAGRARCRTCPCVWRLTPSPQCPSHPQSSWLRREWGGTWHGINVQPRHLQLWAWRVLGVAARGTHPVHRHKLPSNSASIWAMDSTSPPRSSLALISEYLT